MHIVSVCLHYGNIIWLPWQRPLKNWKIRYRSIIGTQSAFIWWKDYKNRSNTYGDIRRNMLNHNVNTQPISIRIFLHWNYWTDLHQIVHDIVAWVAGSSKWNRATILERAKNACSISLLSFRQHYLVVMRTSLDKLEKIKYRSIIGSSFIWRKDCEIRFSTSGDIRRNTPNHDVKITQFRLESSPPKVLDRSSSKLYMM